MTMLLLTVFERKQQVQQQRLAEIAKILEELRYVLRQRPVFRVLLLTKL